VEIIKLATLGRGGYTKLGKVLRREGRLEFRTIVKPDYASINFIDRSQFPTGVILYLFGEPLGTVISMRPGNTEGPERRVLESVELHWIWTRNLLSRAEWCLESVEPIASTAEFREIRFNESPPQGSGTVENSPGR
jgi:hypothetical protein